MEVQRVRKRILTQKIKREKRQNQYIGRSEEDKVRKKVDGRNEGRKDIVQTNKIPTFTDEGDTFINLDMLTKVNFL